MDLILLVNSLCSKSERPRLSEGFHIKLSVNWFVSETPLIRSLLLCVGSKSFLVFCQQVGAVIVVEVKVQLCRNLSCHSWLIGSQPMFGCLSWRGVKTLIIQYYCSDIFRWGVYVIKTLMSKTGSGSYYTSNNAAFCLTFYIYTIDIFFHHFVSLNTNSSKIPGVLQGSFTIFMDMFIF